MESGDIAKVAGAVGPILVATLGLVAASAASRSRHARLRDSAELLSSYLSRASLGNSWRLRTIIRLAEDDEKQRSTFGIVLALVFVVFAGWTWTLALDGSNWWSVLAVPLTIFGVMGFTMDVQREKRDEKGRRIRS